MTGPIGSQNSEVVVKHLQGELLYTLLSTDFPDLAGKITGMILELTPQEVMRVVESSDIFRD